MKFVIAAVATLALATAAAASTAVFSAAGSMKFGQPLTGTFTLASTADLTATLTVNSPNPGTSYMLVLRHYTPNGYVNQVCQDDGFYPDTTVSCQIPSAFTGAWQVVAKPRAGKYGSASGSVTVTAS